MSVGKGVWLYCDANRDCEASGDGSIGEVLAGGQAMTGPTRGYFGIAVYRPKTAANVGSLWRSADLYGAAFLGTVAHRYQRQASDTGHAANNVPLIHYRDLDDMLEHLPRGCPLVGVELDPRARSLSGFVHPERALYLLGAEDDGLPPAVLDRCHHLVQIPTAVPRSMNVACAGSVLLAHRFMAGEVVAPHTGRSVRSTVS